MRSRFHTLVSLIVLATPLMAHAQTSDDRPVRRVEVDVGGGMLGGAALGSADANLLANDPVRRPFRVFSTTSRIASAPAFHARAVFAFNHHVGVEGGIVLSRPDVQTSLTGDVEDAPGLTVAERVDQYFIEAGVVIMIDRLRAGRRTVPFVAAGAGYLRQLHEGRTVVEQGQVYHAGGGVKHWLVARDGSFVRAAGLRADARLYLLAAGISFEEHPRSHAAISGSVFLTF